jgi:hypothetical protein
VLGLALLLDLGRPLVGDPLDLARSISAGSGCLGFDQCVDLGVERRLACGFVVRIG